MKDSSKTIIVLLGVLLAVLVVAGLAVWLLPAQQGEAPPTGQSAIPTSNVSSSLDTTVLNRSDYSALDTRLLQQGALPVQPPVTTGKANPFL